MRRVPPPFPRPVPAVIRAVERPFEFEATIELDPHAEDNDGDELFPAPAAPSHHEPVMGLGGALISQHRRTVAEERAARRRAAGGPTLPQQMYNFYISAMRRLSGGNRRTTPNVWSQTDQDALLAQVLAANDPPDIFLFPSSNADQQRSQSNDPEYIQSYTHQPKPPPGFLFDFAPNSSSSSPTTTSSPISLIVIDDSPGASTSAVRSEDAATILVCARCLDALTLNSGSDDKRRMWGLRCGHMIDGKCMDQIMKPISVVDVDVDVKGKERAVDEKEEPSLDTRTVDANSYFHSMKARLRSRRRPPGQPESPTGPIFSARRRPISHPSHSEDELILHPRPRRRGQQSKNRKGKSKATELRVQASHEWTCPVAGCGKVHTSLLIEDKWVMDKEKGAIGIYA
jgi:hypothetical protein